MKQAYTLFGEARRNQWSRQLRAPVGLKTLNGARISLVQSQDTTNTEPAFPEQKRSKIKHKPLLEVM